MCPKIKSAKRIVQVKRKIATKTSVRFKNRKSIKEKAKKITKPKSTQIICLFKNAPPSESGANDFIVTRPERMIGTMKKINSQSILLKTFSAIPVLKF